MRIFSICGAAVAVAVIVAGCAQEVTSGANEETQRYYNAWVKVQKDNNPDYLWYPFSYGTTSDGGEYSDYAYILEETEGDGEEVPDSSYVFVTYTYTDLLGNVQATTDMTLSHKTNVNYDLTYYYGPMVWVSHEAYIGVGLKDALTGWKDGEECYGPMKIGGSRKLLIPGWLSGTTRYDTADEYLANVTGSDYIYDITVTDYTDDILQYQIDSIESYCTRKYGSADSVYTGFYFYSLADADDDITFEDDTTIYVNYIGRLLNGHVFDTNIEDTAKVWNLYSSSNTYGPTEVNWSSDSTAVTLSESSVITGFGSIISRMGAYQTAVGVFYSALGYGSSGSDYVIPAYAPLEFEIRIVDEE